MSGHVTRESFQARLLGIMDRKDHWAWPYFSGERVTREHLLIHYRQEWAVYVRDFPVFLARIYGKGPPAEVRALLAENIYEEETGRLSLGHSHPSLFLKMMQGLGFAPESFDHVDLLPASRTYRAWLDRMSAQPRWVLGAAALTIFVEGSVKDRQELMGSTAERSPQEIEEAVAAHPLARVHGLPPPALDLIRAHQMVERGHREAAYRMVLDHAAGAEEQDAVLSEVETGLSLWLQYRDGVAYACGLKKPEG